MCRHLLKNCNLVPHNTEAKNVTATIIHKANLADGGGGIHSKIRLALRSTHKFTQGKLYRHKEAALFYHKIAWVEWDLPRDLCRHISSKMKRVCCPQNQSQEKKRKNKQWRGQNTPSFIQLQCERDWKEFPGL